MRQCLKNVKKVTSSLKMGGVLTSKHEEGKFLRTSLIKKLEKILKSRFRENDKNLKKQGIPFPWIQNQASSAFLQNCARLCEMFEKSL